MKGSENTMRNENGTLNRPGCTEIRPLLIDHLRGESGRRHDTIARHLDTCADCREWADFLRAIEGAVPGREAGGRLGFERRMAGVMAAAGHRADPQHTVRRLVVRVAGVAALVVALFGGLFPPVSEAVLWIVQGLTTYPLHVLAGTTGLLLLSSPLLFATARRRMEDVS